MRSSFTALFIGAALLLGASSVLAAEPVIGTWQLNVAKSKFSPGPAPKSQTRVYAETPQGISLTIKSVSADGKEGTMKLTFKPDGNAYKVTGNPDFDSVKVTSAGDSSVNSTEFKAGAKVGTAVRSVSKDGTTLTFNQKGTHADGTAYEDVLVYDKQ